MTEGITKANMILPLSTKKSKLLPRPQIGPEDGLESSVCKRKTEQASKSSKVSTSKLEVTFAEDVDEIANKENEVDNNEESNSVHISPRKHSLKSVKEHIKTPFSKIKEGEEGDTPLNKSLAKSALLSGRKIELTGQPDFNNFENNVQFFTKENLSPILKSVFTLKRISENESEKADINSVQLSESNPENKNEATVVAEVEETEKTANNNELTENCKQPAEN
jgi:hypothetical protein